MILRVKHIGQDIRTWAFVEYGSAEMVEPAIAGSESLELGGVPCTVEARKSTPTPRYSRSKCTTSPTFVGI